MYNSDSYDSKLSQARGLASQLGMFAEENDIPKDLWDSLEATIYDFYEVLMIDKILFRSYQLLKSRNFE